jgi:hypothetical protein
MEKQDYSQLDLFNRAQESESSAQRLSGTFLSYIRTYEQLVLMVIGLVVTGVVCFCVGVEKGKHLASSQFNRNLDFAYSNRALPPQSGAGALQAPPRARSGAGQVLPRSDSGAAPAAPRLSAPAIPVAPAAKQPVRSVPVTVNQPMTVARSAQRTAGDAFTIQIGSYEGTASAQQELSTLKKQGFLPVIKSSGKYTVLCVGNFPDQATARSLLTQLKRKYRDCYIRRL